MTIDALLDPAKELAPGFTDPIPEGQVDGLNRQQFAALISFLGELKTDLNSDTN